MVSCIATDTLSIRARACMHCLVFTWHACGGPNAGSKVNNDVMDLLASSRQHRGSVGAPDDVANLVARIKTLAAPLD